MNTLQYIEEVLRDLFYYAKTYRIYYGGVVEF